MPELPDVAVYCEALNRHYAGSLLVRIDVRSPFVLRTYQPEIQALLAARVVSFHRMGKRIVGRFDSGLCLVLHLMIAGRLHQRPAGRRPRGKHDLVAFHFAAAPEASIAATLMLTEQGSKRQASLGVYASFDDVLALDPGGLEVESASPEEFRTSLLRENHTLKRALCDPRLFSGIGNAYSDEILHAAQLSPLLWTSRLNDDQIERLFDASRRLLAEWTERLRQECGDGFPEKVTAFRPEMAAHGRYGQPCPVCGGKIARIRYATRETNYCPTCQTGGKLLADRSLSRLLGKDWETFMSSDE
jgi:formamidopyrimidine-DNA glycosylase